MSLRRTFLAACALLWIAGVDTVMGEASALPSCVDVHVDDGVHAARLVASHVRRELFALLADGAGPCAQVHVRSERAGSLRIALAHNGRTLVVELSDVADDGPRYARVAGLTAAALLRQLPFTPPDDPAQNGAPAPLVLPATELPTEPAPLPPDASQLEPRALPQEEPAAERQGPVEEDEKAPAPPPAPRGPKGHGDTLFRLGAVLSMPRSTPFASGELGVGYLPFPRLQTQPRVELVATGLFARASSGATTARLWAEGGALALTFQPLKTARSALRLGANVRVFAAQLRGSVQGGQSALRSLHVLASAGARAELEYALSARATAQVALDGGYVMLPLRVRAGDAQVMDYAGALAAATLGLRLR
jgi:hypothetical protein